MIILGLMSLIGSLWNLIPLWLHQRKDEPNLTLFQTGPGPIPGAVPLSKVLIIAGPILLVVGGLRLLVE